jgi:hypothetical protein
MIIVYTKYIFDVNILYINVPILNISKIYIFGLYIIYVIEHIIFYISKKCQVPVDRLLKCL